MPTMSLHDLTACSSYMELRIMQINRIHEILKYKIYDKD